MPVDLLYLAKNRLEFTRESFSQLLVNTDWDMVREFHIVDDGSVDGTDQYLSETVDAARATLPEITIFRRAQFGSPVLAFNEFVQSTRAPLVAKLDNDTCVPPGWLRSCVNILEAWPELLCLGLEPFHPVNPDMSIARTYQPATHTGGIGVFRRSTFADQLPTARNVYFGFGDWQLERGVSCGWIRPALPVFLLDHLPFEPWRSLSKLYIEKGWQRSSWGEYAHPANRTNQDHGPELWGWRFKN